MKEELEFSSSRSSKLQELHPAVARRLFIGAITVLRFRKKPVTVDSLRILLYAKPQAIKEYLDAHPRIKALLDEEPKT